MNNLQKVLKMVEVATDIEDLTVKSRKRNLVEARALFIHLAKDVLKGGDTEIADALNLERSGMFNYYKKKHYDYPDFTFKHLITPMTLKTAKLLEDESNVEYLTMKDQMEYYKNLVESNQQDFKKIVNKKDREIAELIKKVLKFDSKKDKVERFIDSYAFSRLISVNDETFSKVERKVNAMLN